MLSKLFGFGSKKKNQVEIVEPGKMPKEFANIIAEKLKEVVNDKLASLTSTCEMQAKMLLTKDDEIKDLKKEIKKLEHHKVKSNKPSISDGEQEVLDMFIKLNTKNRKEVSKKLGLTPGQLNGKIKRLQDKDFPWIGKELPPEELILK